MRLYLTKTRTVSQCEDIRWRAVNFYTRQIEKFGRFHQMMAACYVEGCDETPPEKLIVGRTYTGLDKREYVAYGSRLTPLDPRYDFTYQTLDYIKERFPRSLGRTLFERYEDEFARDYPGVDMVSLITPESQRLVDEFRYGWEYTKTCNHRKWQVNDTFLRSVYNAIIKADCSYGMIDATINGRGYILQFQASQVTMIKSPEASLAIEFRDDAVTVDRSHWWAP